MNYPSLGPNSESEHLPPGINISGISNLLHWKDATWHTEQAFTEDHIFTTHIYPDEGIMLEIRDAYDGDTPSSEVNRIYLDSNASSITVEQERPNINDYDNPSLRSTSIRFDLEADQAQIETLNDLIRRWMFTTVYNWRMRDDWGQTECTKGINSKRIQPNDSQWGVAQEYQSSTAALLKTYVEKVIEQDTNES